jgi:hypothetical protein
LSAADPEKPIDSPKNPADQAVPKQPACGCRTAEFTPNVSRCLMKRKLCEHALSFGYTSIFCTHPSHHEFRDNACARAEEVSAADEFCSCDQSTTTGLGLGFVRTW